MNGSSSNEADSSVIVKRSTDVRSVDHDDVVDNQDLRRESLGQHDEGQSRIYQVLASTSKVNGSGIGLKEHLEGNRNEEEFVVTSASSFGSIDQQSNQIRDHDPGSLQSQRLQQQKLSPTAANHAKTVNSIIEATGYSREEADSMTISSSMRLLNDLSGLISGQDTVSHEQSEERPRLTTRTGQGHHGKDIHYQDGDEVDQLLEDAPEDKSQEVVEDDSWSEDEIPEEDIPITKEERVGGQLEVGQAHGEARTVLQHEFDETPDEEESRTDDEDRVLEVIEVGQHQPAKRLRTENVTMEVTPVVSQAPTSELQMHLSQPTVKAVQLDEIQHNVRQDSRIYRQHNPAEQTYYQPQGSSYPAGYMYNSYSFTGNSQAPGYPVESREQMRDDFMTGHSASVNNHPPNMTMRSYQDYVETISPPPNKINKYSRMYHEEKMSYMLSSHGSSLYYGNHVDQPLDVGNTMISPREQLARQLDVRQQDTPPSSLRKPPRLILPQTARPPRSSNSRKPNVKKKQLVCPNQEAPGTAMKRRSPHSVSACSSPIEGNCFHFPPPLFPPWSPFYVTGPPNNNSPVTVSNPPFVMWTPMYGNKPSSLPNNIPVNEHTCMCIECVDTRLRNDVLAKKAEGQVYGTHTAMSVAQRTNVNSKVKTNILSMSQSAH